MVKQAFQPSPFHLFLSCICNAETLYWFDDIKKILTYSIVTLLKNLGLSISHQEPYFYQRYQGIATEFVRQSPKMNSFQCSSCTTERNGPGGSGTHDLSASAGAFLIISLIPI
jgi:hypothetical protein